LEPGESITIDVSSTPEPSSLALLGTGAMSLIGYGWRLRKRIA
jgi:hypothetical protein